MFLFISNYTTSMSSTQRFNNELTAIDVLYMSLNFLKTILFIVDLIIWDISIAITAWRRNWELVTRSHLPINADKCPLIE